MKKTIFLLSAILATAGLNAQSTWKFDPAHTTVEFEISHMVITDVTGKFHSFDGEVTAAKDDFTDAKISFSIDAASINTENERRDGHLKSPDFFDVEKFPKITFEGKSIQKIKDNSYKLTGDFTMHGITREISLDVDFNGIARDPWGNTKAGFKVTGVIDREDFGLTWNKDLENGGVLVGNDVTIICRVQLVKAG